MAKWRVVGANFPVANLGGGPSLVRCILVKGFYEGPLECHAVEGDQAVDGFHDKVLTMGIKQGAFKEIGLEILDGIGKHEAMLVDEPAHHQGRR